MVCVERTVSSEIILDAPDGTLGNVAHVDLILVHLEIVLVSVQDRSTVCTKRTIASEIILNAPDGTPR
jgi:hypothetical protein